MKRFSFYFLIVTAVWLTSCDKNTELVPAGKFDRGVFVVNEGNFGSGDGSVSFINPNGEVTQSIFSQANNGALLGDVVQSMYVADQMGFVVVNNSNRVEAVDINTFESRYSIVDAALPRYLVHQGAKGYLSEWVSFADPGRVTVFDLQTGEISNRITTDFGAEQLLISGEKLFVSNNFSATLSVIDLATESVDTTFTVGNGPGQMVADTDGSVWLICAGGYDANWNPALDGKIVKINPQTYEIMTTVALGMNVAGKLAASADQAFLYFYTGKSVYAFLKTANAPDLLFEETSATGFYGIGTDVAGTLYLADAKGFQAAGEVYTYQPDGTFREKYTVGRGPNGFLFR
ncbi:MAG: DUF5074 domain-containing protein [Cyclobacteriaceae bacterium]|nr:DUF5074 domain-containing protein [Cyclobacteriaceae bacterium]